MTADDNFGEGTYGGGTYGDVGVVSSELGLHVVTKTNSVATLAWTKQEGVYQYLLFRTHNGNRSLTSNSFDGSKTTWKTQYSHGDTFEVIAVALLLQDSVNP